MTEFNTCEYVNVTQVNKCLRMSSVRTSCYWRLERDIRPGLGRRNSRHKGGETSLDAGSGPAGARSRAEDVETAAESEAGVLLGARTKRAVGEDFTDVLTLELGFDM